MLRKVDHVLRFPADCLTLLATRTVQDFQPWRLGDKYAGPSGIAEPGQLHVKST